MRPRMLPVFLFVALAAFLTTTILVTQSSDALWGERTGVRLVEAWTVCGCYALLYYASIRWARLTLGPYLFAAHFVVTALGLAGLTHLGFILELIEIWAADRSKPFMTPVFVSSSIELMFLGSFFLFPTLLLAAVIRERRGQS